VKVRGGLPYQAKREKRRYGVPSMVRCYRRLAREVCDLIEELVKGV